MRIRELRKEFDLTQEQLGEKIGQTKSNISKYETGALEPGIDTLNTLAKFFDVSLDYLIGNSDIRNPYKDKPSIPEEFENPEEAVKFLLEQNVIMGFGGFDVHTMSDEEVLEFANELLNHLRLLSYKYRK
ncbi:helix-turn-helix domain-containing protein [Senegalia massiliensis]|uniref:helix-turn-helix domain-containing protein n=1 Tax=Senegalia massiliensis TaxID=1720316 RepID=UPI0013EF5B4D|nr:helix-turn-helix transcriptional regulator [Senegalia massiliensis]